MSMTQDFGIGRRCPVSEDRIRHESNEDEDWDVALNRRVGYEVDEELSSKLREELGLDPREAAWQIWKFNL